MKKTSTAFAIGLLLASLVAWLPFTVHLTLVQGDEFPRSGSSTLADIAGGLIRPSLAREVPNLEGVQGELDAMAVFSPSPDVSSSVCFHFRAGMRTQAGFGTSTVLYLISDEVLRVQFPGSNPVVPIGIDPLGSVTSYFTGSDPSGWRTGLVDFGGIIYENLYPGVDLVYKAVGGMLKYEFIVHPGADPSSIVMEFSGADSIAVEPGEVRAILGSGCLVDGGLITYQGDGLSKTLVDCAFKQQGPTSVSFCVATYDPSRALVIDPIPNVLRYSTFLGAGGDDYCNAIAVDGGYAYVTGYTDSDPFNTTAFAYDTALYPTTYDVFVTKLAVDGSGLVYSTYLGGNGDDRGFGIAVEGGYAYVTGQAGGTTALWGSTGYDRSRNGGVYDAFVTKLNLLGTSVMYSTYLGGSGDDFGRSIAVENGNAYVAGETSSPTFNTTTGFDLLPNGNVDAFVTKLGTTGTSLVYSTVLGGADSDYAYGIDVEGGYAYVAGMTASNPFNTTADAFDTTFNGVSFFDGFVTKFNIAGNALVYSTFLGGTDFDCIWDVDVEDGNAYVVGETQSVDIPSTGGAFDSTYNGGTTNGDAFAAKLSADGASLAYCTYIGGSTEDAGKGIAVNDGSAYIVGYTDSSSFPTTVGALDRIRTSSEAFVTKLSADGTRLDYSTFLGGSGMDQGRGIAAGCRVVYVCGFTSSSNFTTNPLAFDRVIGTAPDGFVLMLGEDADSDTVPDDWEATYGLSTSADNRLIDTDLDGISDKYEFTMGTDPTDPDTDGDGMPDAWEDDYGLNPLVNDAGGDEDLDLLTNGQEFAVGTYPDDGDSDNDGLLDGQEVNVHHTDPLSNADADRDGLTDATEINVHMSNPHKIDTDDDNLSDPYEANLGTSLTEVDTDGDNFDDGVEVARGTDPTDARSFPGSSVVNPLAFDEHDYIVIGITGAISLAAIVIALALHSHDKKAIKRLESKLAGNVRDVPVSRGTKPDTAASKKAESPPVPKGKGDTMGDTKAKGKK